MRTLCIKTTQCLFWEHYVSDPKRVEFILDYMVGAYFGVIKHWMIDDMPYSPQEMATFHTSLHSVELMDLLKLFMADELT